MSSVPTHVRAPLRLSSEAGWSLLCAVGLGLLVAYSSELTGYGGLRATAGIVVFCGFLIAGLYAPGVQLAYFVALSPLLVFLEQGQRPFQLHESLRLLMLGVLLARAAGQPGFRALLGRPENKALLLFLAWALLLTLIHSVDVFVGFAVYVRHASYMLLLLIVPMLADRDSIRRLVIPALLLTAGAAAAVAAALAAADLAAGRLPYGMGGSYRATGVFDTGAPNSFAVYLTTMLVFGVCVLWMTRTTQWMKLIGLLTFPVVIGVILYTFSRRALVTLAVGIALVAARTRGNHQRALLAGALALTVVLALVAVPREILLNPRIMDLVEAQAQGQLASSGPAEKRFSQFAEVSQHLTWSAWDLLIGLRTGAASLFATRYLGIWIIPPIDNYYMSLTADFGLVGLVLYLTIGFSVWVRLWRLTRADSPDRGIYVGALAAMTVILVSGLAGNTNMTFPNALYLWLLPALAFALPAPASTGRTRTQAGEVFAGVNERAVRGSP